MATEKKLKIEWCRCRCCRCRTFISICHAL